MGRGACRGAEVWGGGHAGELRYREWCIYVVRSKGVWLNSWVLPYIPKCG